MSDILVPGQTRRYANQFEFQHHWLTSRGLNVGCDADTSGLKQAGCLNTDIWYKNPFTGMDCPADVIADARKLPFFDNDFGCVILGDILEHFIAREDVIKSLREARRVCRVGGRVIVTCPEDHRSPADQDGHEEGPLYCEGVRAWHAYPVTLAMMREWGAEAGGLREIAAAWIAYPFTPQGGWGITWQKES